MEPDLEVKEKRLDQIFLAFLVWFGQVISGIIDDMDNTKSISLILFHKLNIIFHDFRNIRTLVRYLNCFFEFLFTTVKCRWGNIKALPGANRLIKHFSSHGVPMALASNSPRVNIESKISSHQGILFQALITLCSLVGKLACNMHQGYYVLCLSFLSLFTHYFPIIGWKQSFSVIIGGDEVTYGKPSPEM